MTGSTPIGPNSPQAGSSPLTLGAENYFAVMRSQLEITMQLTAAWASAVSAMTSRMVAQAPSAGSAATQASPGTGSDSVRSLRSVRDVGGNGSPSSEEEYSAESIWNRPVLDQPAPGRMLRWLTELPTLQTNLFDETIELLLDEDIKTAS